MPSQYLFLIQKSAQAPIDEFLERTAVHRTETQVANTSKSSGQVIASRPSVELPTVCSEPTTPITSTTANTDNDISGNPHEPSQLSYDHRSDNSPPTLHTGMSEPSPHATGVEQGTSTTDDDSSEPDMQQNGDQLVTNEEDEMAIDEDHTNVAAAKKQSASNCLKRKRGNESEDEYSDDDDRDSDDEIPPEDTKPVIEVLDEEDLADM